MRFVEKNSTGQPWHKAGHDGEGVFVTSKSDRPKTCELLAHSVMLARSTSRAMVIFITSVVPSATWAMRLWK